MHKYLLILLLLGNMQFSCQVEIMIKRAIYKVKNYTKVLRNSIKKKNITENITNFITKNITGLYTINKN